MSQILVSNIASDETEYSMNICGNQSDTSAVMDTNSIKNENFDTPVSNDIYIKEEPLDAVDDSDALFEVESLNPLNQVL